MFLVLVGVLGAFLLPDVLRRHRLYQAAEAALPAWRSEVVAHARCVDARLGDHGSTAEGLFWTRLRAGSLPPRLRDCGGRHLTDPSLWDDSLRTEGVDDPLASALSRFRRTLGARRRDHGPSLPGVDDRAIRGACDRLQSLASDLGEVEKALGVAPTLSPNPCELLLPGLTGLRPPPSAAADQLLDVQVRADRVVTQLRPADGGTRFAIARLGANTAGSDPVSVQWTLTAPMPVLADGRDYGWEAEGGLWTVGFDTTARRWRGYHWKTQWRPLAWLPPGYTPDRVDWAAELGAPLVVARTGPVDAVVFRLDEERAHGPTALRRVERFDPMTHIGRTGSVTIVDLEFPAAGPHLSVSHRPAPGSELTQAFVPLADARTEWFLQPHVVGCSHERRHWAVVGSRWLAPTEDGGDGRWWILTSGDDGATWHQVGKTPKEWQLFSPVLACRGDTLVNLTVARPKGEAHTVFVECTPDTCQPPKRLVEPAARHVGLHWSDTGLSVLLAFRAHAARFRLHGAPFEVEPNGAFRRLPVRSAWDTITHIGAHWFDLVTVDPLPW